MLFFLILSFLGLNFFLVSSKVCSLIIGLLMLFASTVFFGTMVPLSRNPINALCFFIGTILNASLFLIYLGFDFLAVVLLTIYLGAIAIFFLFTIMFLNITFQYKRRLLSLVEMVLGVLIIGTCAIFLNNFVVLAFVKNELSLFKFTTLNYNYFYFYTQIYESIGYLFFTYYGASFLLIGLLLFIVMVGVIIITGEVAPLDVNNRTNILKTNRLRNPSPSFIFFKI